MKNIALIFIPPLARICDPCFVLQKQKRMSAIPVITARFTKARQQRVGQFRSKTNDGMKRACKGSYTFVSGIFGYNTVKIPDEVKIMEHGTKNIAKNCIAFQDFIPLKIKIHATAI